MVAKMSMLAIVVFILTLMVVILSNTTVGSLVTTSASRTSPDPSSELPRSRKHRRWWHLIDVYRDNCITAYVAEYLEEEPNHIWPGCGDQNDTIYRHAFKRGETPTIDSSSTVDPKITAATEDTSSDSEDHRGLEAKKITGIVVGAVAVAAGVISAYVACRHRKHAVETRRPGPALALGRS
ncbi:hypothetical protein MKZ38_001594 [Zalerion maritima]|uniref:Uncharacterized protein n=1 Tax=Zalerion maritima TaxID=339359 RepID=A0AAD5RQ45_9PEZI|nr:hypothetical protein MKZ38_001594 [Zalerion maritima]